MESVKTVRVFMTAVIANISAIVTGTCMAWTSPIGPKLKSNDTSDSPLSHPIDATADAWISSIMALGALTGRMRKALHSLQFLRGQSVEAVQAEMRSIELMVEASLSERGTIMDIVKNGGSRKALFICLGLIALQQGSGIDAILFNTESIFASAHMNLKPAIAVIIIYLVQAVAAGLIPFIADRFGRKTILLTSAVAMFLGLAAFGVFFYIDNVQSGATNLHWLPVPALVLYIVAYTMGFGPLPWAVVSEVFTPNVKSIASSMSASICWIVGFFVAFFYPMLHALGVYYAFWLFAGCSLVAFFFVWCFVIETKGLSLQEIQDKLKGLAH